MHKLRFGSARRAWWQNLLLLVSAACVGAAEPRDLTSEMESLRAKYKLPACASAVVEKGRIVAIGASGLRRADRNIPVTTGDIWHIGSCTKSMTAVLVGVLVDTGKLRWDMPVPEALTGVPCHPAWRQVTIWHLVTHRSGLGQIWLPENNRVVVSRTPREQREAFARSILSRPPDGPPGKSAYSNAGYGVLGAILENVANESYEEMLRKYVFNPLSLKSAGFGPPSTPGRIDQPWGHRRQGDRLTPIDPASGSSEFPPALAPAACVHMSLEDFARYAAWVSTNEPHLMKEETFSQLQTPPAGQAYAGGLWKTELPGIGGAALCHTGHLGGFFAVFYAAHDRACVSVFNTEGGGWEWLGDEITAGALRATFPPRSEEKRASP